MNRLLSRRNVLRGAGVCLALPWLESLAPRGALAQSASLPKRYIPIYFPNGAPLQWWENAPPFGSGVFSNDFVLSRIHEPLAPIKSKLLVLSRVANYTWKQSEGENPGPGVEPSHARCPGALMTCTDADAKAMAAGMPLPSAVINGVSADQVIVQNASFGTPLESMQVGLGSFPGAFDGRSYSYNQVMSWKSDTEPLKRQINPKAVFDLMINAGATSTNGEVDPAADAAAKLRAAENKSVLDAVVENANSLKMRLSRQDRETLDQYTTSFREIEKNVTGVTQTISSGCQVVTEPAAIPEPQGAMQGLNQGQNGYDRAAHAKVMNDLIVMALQCDMTRIITYMLDDSRSEFNYSFIPDEDVVFGATGGIDNFHGGAQHGPGNISGTAENGVYPGSGNAAFATIDRWLVRQVSELAQKLDAIPEGDGTVLDHTLLLMTSAMRTHDHDAYDLPMLLLGGTGFIKQDGHIALGERPSDRQFRDLQYTIMRQYYGLDVTSFGDDMRGAPNELIEEILA